MSRTSPHRIFLIISLLLTLGLVVGAQTRVKITADRTSILIGEPIRLSLEADIPENEPIRFFQPDSIARFEILRSDKIDTNNTSKGTVLTGAIYITSFDSGHLVIPPLLLRDSIYTDSIPVYVGYTPFDTAKPYNDIKEIIDADAKKDDSANYWWYVIPALLILAIILYFVFRKKKPVEQKIIPPVDAYDEAMVQLSALRLEKQEASMYYSKLVNIFRVYVSRRKGIESMQQTTPDLIAQLAVLNLPALLYDRVGSSLRFSDLVKFARFMPSPEEDENAFGAVKESIEVIEQAHRAGLAAERRSAETINTGKP